MKISALVVSLMAAPAFALQGGYLSQFAGPPAAVKPSSFKPTGTSGQVSSGTGGYLNNLNPSAPAAPAAPEPVAFVPTPAEPAPAFSLSSTASTAPSAGDYLQSLRTEGAPSGSGPAGYLDTLPSGSAPPSGGGQFGYLDALRTESATPGSGPVGYLQTIASETGVAKKGSYTASVSTPPSSTGTSISQEPVLQAIEELSDNMTQNQDATIGVLKDINESVRRLVDASV